MASIPGFQFNVTGASGTQGLLAPQSGWRAYILPRGASVKQSASGTLLTFDSASAASRFAVNNWIQVGLDTSYIRQVSAVGGNSIAVSGANISASLNARVFLIGNTQPTVSGGSATYTVPNTLVYTTDDDAGSFSTNSMFTSDSNGLVQGWAATNFYDAIVQDGNRTNQLGIYDLAVGAVEGISLTGSALMGGSLTVNGALGVTGWATFGSTVTMNANAGVTGTLTVDGAATFNAAVGITGTLGVSGAATFHGAIGVTGTAVFGTSVTLNGALGVTGWATFGSTVTITGAIGVTGTGAFGSTVTMNANAGVTGTLIVGQTFTATAGASFGSTAYISGTCQIAGAFQGSTAVSLVTGTTTALGAGFVFLMQSIANTTCQSFTPVTPGRAFIAIGTSGTTTLTKAGGNIIYREAGSRSVPVGDSFIAVCGVTQWHISLMPS